MLRDSANRSTTLESYLGVFRYSRRAVQLVWTTHRGLTIALAVATVAAGILPAGVAFVGKLIVDAVVAQINVVQAGGAAEYDTVRFEYKWLFADQLVSTAARTD